MNKIENLYLSMVEEWRTKAKGNGMINFGPRINYIPVVLGILQQVYNKNPTAKVIVLTNNKNQKDNLITYITSTNDVENNKEFKKLISDKLLKIRDLECFNCWIPKEQYYLGVIIGVNMHHNIIDTILFATKFHLVCLTADGSTKTKLFNKCLVICDEQIKELTSVCKNTPVEETQIGVTIDDAEDINNINKYTEYITDSIKIFGSFEVMSYAKNGNPICNISATQICYDIAKQNGWSETLDMNIPFNVQIDACYNPNVLRERVELTYELIRKRNNLVCNNKAKLKVILDIVNENPDKRILIVNNSTDFAKQVTTYLNSNLEHYSNGFRLFDPCYNYHDDLDKVVSLDYYGKPLLVKSGVDKGKVKMIAAKAQKTMAEEYINNGFTRILSTNNSPDKNLTCDFDIMIITSSRCELFESYKYRLANVNFEGNPFKVFKLYCYGTIEEKELYKQKPSDNYIIVNNSKNNIKIDENLGVILA